LAMNGLRGWDYQPVYEASNANLVDDFYVPSLRRATTYDRAAGYFRSSIYHLIAVALSDFVMRGGRMRLICSPSLDDSDEDVIRRFGVQPEAVERSLTADVTAALEHPEQFPVAQLLATLLVAGQLDIRIAYKADERGIFHSKVGVFHDGLDAVSFEGSANETYMAWEFNEERFKAFCSWRNQEPLIQADQRYFNQLWDGERPSLVVASLPTIPLRLLRQHALPDPEAAVEQVRLARSRHSRPRGQVRRLQDHQLAVKRNWWLTQRGLIDHATGGGKTVTALAIIREWFDRRPSGSVIVIVPSDLLTQQWRREMDSEFADLDVRYLQVGGTLSVPKWRELLPDFTREATVRGRRIVIATMDSAASPSFVSRANAGDQTLLVVDEVHKVGSPGRSAVLALDAAGRLGLSATPERYEDAEGTERILGYFGAVLPPSFGIRDAQRCDPPRLVPYLYMPGVVGLTAIELNRHARLSEQIARVAARLREGDPTVSRDQLHRLLIDRARILKSAAAKAPHAAELLDNEYRPDERWLVYCDDNAQLDQLRRMLVERGRDPMTYTSEMIFSKPDTLLRFERIGGILLSIRCLDEGIDIPTVSHALILASSLNPREHIQRRGRVLRTSPGKVRAIIHDVLVGPNVEEPDQVFAQDLNRAFTFASDAENHRQATWRLSNLHPFPAPSTATSWGDVEDDDSHADGA
jgi:superfamily II DNA or RNA helicase